MPGVAQGRGAPPVLSIVVGQVKARHAWARTQHAPGHGLAALAQRLDALCDGQQRAGHGGGATVLPDSPRATQHAPAWALLPVISRWWSWYLPGCFERSGATCGAC